MNINTYQKEALKTIKLHPDLLKEDRALLDWALGLSGEVGEVCELVKHKVFHKEPLSKMKIAKELGDVAWYLAAIATELGFSLEDCLKLNLAKLKHRHGESFCFDKSASRHKKEENFTETEVYKSLKMRINKG